jgi:hypothetical protein
MVEDRDFAERVTLKMVGRFRLALEHVELHLFELRHALFGEDHLNRTDIGGAVKTPEDNVGHDWVPSQGAVQADPQA